MSSESDTFEWRRFGHWKSTASKTRFSAFLLWNLKGNSWVDEMADKCGHQTGDSGLAVGEAFRCESAIALELVIKAVIAHKLQASGAATANVPTTHDIPELWKQAGM